MISLLVISLLSLETGNPKIPQVEMEWYVAWKDLRSEGNHEFHLLEATRTEGSIRRNE
jgi:hypothetical protein